MDNSKRDEAIRLISKLDEWQLRYAIIYLRSLKDSEDSSEPDLDQTEKAHQINK